MNRKRSDAEWEQRVNALEEEIVERKRVEEALRQSEANYRLLFSAESDAVLVVDAQSKEIVDANEATLKLYGYDREALMGQSALDLSAEPEKLASYIEYMASGKPLVVSPGPVERLHKTKDGSVFPVEISSGVYALGPRMMVCTIIRDITERKLGQEALERSNIAMLDILESISDGFFSLDHQHIVTYFNAAAGRLLARRSWEVLGHNFFSAFPEFTHTIFEERLVRALNEKSPLAFETYFDVKPYENWYDVRIYPSEDGVSVFFRVTTEAKQAEKEKKKLEAQLQQVKKMRAIGTLAGGIANDFNNLLSIIQANASLLLLDIDKAHPCYANLKKIEKQVQRGAELSAQLLGYAGKGRYKARTIDINQIVKRTAETFAKKRKNITIQCDPAHDLRPTDGDPVQIEQVLWNLYINAADAMPNGGEILLSTRNVSQDTIHEKFSHPQAMDYILVTVTDRGTGMGKEIRDRIFEPFFTTKGSNRRPGLGLTAAYGIIEGHRGYIDFDSSEGKGTSFYIYLPASQRMVDVDLPIDRRIATGTGTVLLVDDDPMVIEVGTRLLKILGYEVLEARGGREAIDICRASKDKIDLVILDMIMPDLNGSETYDRMKDIDPGIKVLLTTGYSIDGEASEIMERGCDGFLQKPFSINELSEKIEEILAKTTDIAPHGEF